MWDYDCVSSKHMPLRLGGLSRDQPSWQPNRHDSWMETSSNNQRNNETTINQELLTFKVAVISRGKRRPSRGIGKPTRTSGLKPAFPATKSGIVVGQLDWLGQGLGFRDQGIIRADTGPLAQHFTLLSTASAIESAVPAYSAQWEHNLLRCSFREKSNSINITTKFHYRFSLRASSPSETKYNMWDVESDA